MPGPDQSFALFFKDTLRENAVIAYQGPPPLLLFQSRDAFPERTSR